MAGRTSTTERCALCGCQLHRQTGTYALPTVEGRSHATEHHSVAERFFGRSKTRRGVRERVFAQCPWNAEGAAEVFCYECHEELLHNPVFLPGDIVDLARLLEGRGLREQVKSASRAALAARIVLIHDVIRAGLDALLEREAAKQPASGPAASPRSR